jgi:hypothetical protein
MTKQSKATWALLGVGLGLLTLTLGVPVGAYYLAVAAGAGNFVGNLAGVGAILGAGAAMGLVPRQHTQRAVDAFIGLVYAADGLLPPASPGTPPGPAPKPVDLDAALSELQGMKWEDRQAFLEKLRDRFPGEVETTHDDNMALKRPVAVMKTLEMKRG